MALVIIESPYRAEKVRDMIRNRRYALAAVAHSLSLGESPFASHILYTEALNDHLEVDRTKGLHAGWALYPKADMVAVYWDLGISKGMIDGVERAARCGCIITYRKIGWPVSLTPQPSLLLEDGRV